MKTNIQEYRLKKKLTQEELGEIVGVTRQTIISLEQGKYNPSLELANKIKNALQANKIEDLFIFE